LNIVSWRERFGDCEWLLPGDFDTDLNGTDYMAKYLNNFIPEHVLHRSDILFNKRKSYIYVNDAQNHCSCIDYMLVSSCDEIMHFDVLDPNINLSDHLPLFAVCKVILLMFIIPLLLRLNMLMTLSLSTTDGIMQILAHIIGNGSLVRLEVITITVTATILLYSTTSE
jgi:hypothetical protein